LTFYALNLLYCIDLYHLLVGDDGLEPLFNTGIKRRFQIIKNELSTNNELKNKVINKVAEKMIVDDCEHNFNVSEIIFLTEAHDFLEGQNSVHTKNNYKKVSTILLRGVKIIK
jgi:hypothetical protein